MDKGRDRAFDKLVSDIAENSGGHLTQDLKRLREKSISEVRAV